MTEFNRRAVLAGAAATTVVTAVGPGILPAAAATPMDSFIGLSSALTGISVGLLRPKRDPLNVKQAYFDRAAKSQGFQELLDLYISHRDSLGADELQNKIMDQGSSLRFLARSIILAWYTGAWYEPSVLETPPSPSIPFEVISATAYTQGFIWRTAHTHPMGYSEWDFGYWAEAPTQKPEQFIN